MSPKYRKPTIYLASSSPRRKKLLEPFFGDALVCVENSYSEDNTLVLPPENLVRLHAKGKAESVVSNCLEGLVIGADTVVVYSDTIFGKPTSIKDAEHFLKTFSGQILEVVSGVSVIEVSTGKCSVAHEVSRVKFIELSQEQINTYLKTGEPMDKAGAFAVQGLGAVFIDWIKGDYTNIVGLPLRLLQEMLLKFDTSLLGWHNSTL